MQKIEDDFCSSGVFGQWLHHLWPCPQMPHSKNHGKLETGVRIVLRLKKNVFFLKDMYAREAYLTKFLFLKFVTSLPFIESAS